MNTLSTNNQDTINAPAQTLATEQAAPQIVLFEATLTAGLSGQGANDMMPVWNHFLNAEFFIAVIKKEEGPINGEYDYAVFTSPQQAEPFVVVSEYAEKMNSHPGQQAVRVRGGNLIHTLNPKTAIVVALSENSLTMPTDLLGWLRGNTQFVPRT